MTYRMSHLIKVIALTSTSLAFAGGLGAQDRDRPDRHEDNQQSRRYEDKTHNDSHEWNEREDQAYRRYLQEHHKKYHDFAKTSKKEQSDYWNWRHDHPDDEHHR